MDVRRQQPAHQAAARGAAAGLVEVRHPTARGTPPCAAARGALGIVQQEGCRMSKAKIKRDESRNKRHAQSLPFRPLEQRNQLGGAVMSESKPVKGSSETRRVTLLAVLSKVSPSKLGRRRTRMPATSPRTVHQGNRRRKADKFLPKGQNHLEDHGFIMGTTCNCFV